MEFFFDTVTGLSPQCNFHVNICVVPSGRVTRVIASSALSHLDILAGLVSNNIFACKMCIH